jgi:hypothetical protein
MEGAMSKNKIFPLMRIDSNLFYIFRNLTILKVNVKLISKRLVL